MDVTIKKSPTSRNELLAYFEDCKQNTLKEACLTEQTSSIGLSCNDYEDFSLTVTSTPHPKNAVVQRKSSSPIHHKHLVTQKNIMNDDSTGTNLSVSKVLVIMEKKRKEDAVAKPRAAMIAREKQALEERAAYQAQLQAQSQAKALKLQEEQLRLLKEEEDMAAERKQRLELLQQRHAQRVSMRDEQIKAAELLKKEEITERRKRAAERLKCVEEVKQHLCQFSDIFNKINYEFKANQALAPLITEVKPLNMGMQSLIQRMKAPDVNTKDVEAAKSICTKISSIHAAVMEQVAKLKKESDERDALKKQEVNPPQIQVNKSPEAVTFLPETEKDSSNYVAELSDCADKESLQWYYELKKVKENNEKLFESLLKDDRVKKYRFDCQKAVNIPVNAISPLNASHMRDKLQKLTLLLSGQSVVIGEGVCVSAARHPGGIPFCKDLLAKKFVKQGASTVSSKPEAAFAIAAVIVALWQEFPDWGQLLLAHFHEECPYLVPVFWPQLEGQSNKDYYQSLGYLYNEEGEVEKQDKFLKRMSGIMRLYAAVLISSLPRDRRNRPHPHGLGQGWRWVSSLLNLEPRPDICASLLYDFLEVAGSSMLQHYGRQFRKLLLVICKGYFPRLQKIAVSSSGPVVRLETFLQTILKQGGSKPPQGMLPSNFW